jgi:hypothetical protein
VAESGQRLTYDNTPAGSTLLREYVDDGAGVIITAAAREPDPLTRRRLRKRAAIPAAWISAAVVVLCAAIFAKQAYANRNMLPWWTGALAALFGGALFIFVWQVRYLGLLESSRMALTQNSIIAVRRRRLLIESSGPLGTHSEDLLLDQIADVRVASGLIPPSARDHSPHDGIAIRLNDGRVVVALLGRTSSELRWVVDVLNELRAKNLIQSDP